MKLFSAKHLFAALAFTAFAAGTAPALAQSQHTGSMMPYYYEGSGAKVWGTWGPKGPSVIDQRVAPPSRQLFLYAGPLTPRQPSNGSIEMRDRFGIESQR